MFHKNTLLHSGYLASWAFNFTYYLPFDETEVELMNESLAVLYQGDDVIGEDVLEARVVVLEHSTSEEHLSPESNLSLRNWKTENCGFLGKNNKNQSKMDKRNLELEKRERTFFLIVTTGSY